MTRCTLGILLAALAVLGGCSTVLAPEPLKHSPNFEPVFPKVETSPEVPTGAIYGGKQSESWFGKGRNYQVGDVITVHPYAGKVTNQAGETVATFELKTQVLLDELVTHYRARVTGETQALAELPIQYADYAAWLVASKPAAPSAEPATSPTASPPSASCAPSSAPPRKRSPLAASPSPRSPKTTRATRRRAARSAPRWPLVCAVCAAGG